MLSTLLETNRRLCEKAGDLNEPAIGNVKDFRQRVMEGAAGSANAFTAKVAQADVPNGNNRIYTRELFGVVLAESKAMIEAGKLAGACDHPGWGVGALRDTCMLWHSLWMQTDGAVYGNFSLIPGANYSTHLKALIDAGAAIGFSTRGWGRAHYPDEAERKRYDLPIDTDTVIVGIDDDYILQKIDAVDDPAVFDAWLDTKSASATKR